MGGMARTMGRIITRPDHKAEEKAAMGMVRRLASEHANYTRALGAIGNAVVATRKGEHGTDPISALGTLLGALEGILGGKWVGAAGLFDPNGKMEPVTPPPDAAPEAPKEG